MTMIAILELRLKSDDVEKSHAAVRETLVDTRKFPGCLAVDVLIDREDPAHLVLVEKWESAEHDQAYRDWRAGDGAPVALIEVLAGPPELSTFELSADI